MLDGYLEYDYFVHFSWKNYATDGIAVSVAIAVHSIWRKAPKPYAIDICLEKVGYKGVFSEKIPSTVRRHGMIDVYGETKQRDTRYRV
jgi:hypothetical protein